MIKRLLILGWGLFMCLIFLTGCTQNYSKFTEAEHIIRISERIEQRFPNESVSSIYPLFNVEDELTHFMVEFESGRFEFIMLFNPPFFSWTGSPQSMYRIAEFNDYPWRRYTYKTDLTDIVLGSEESKLYEDTYRNYSPYIEAGVGNERRYFIGGGIIAVRSNDKFLNLVSMDYIRDSEPQPTLNIYFHYSKDFDL